MLSEEHCWTQGADARDEAGGILHSDDPDAVCHCLAGAIEVVWNAGQILASDLLYSLLPEEYRKAEHSDEGLREWNDGVASYEDVMNLIKLGLGVCAA